MSEINKIKMLVGRFVSETKSTNIHEFVTWVDCQILYAENEARVKK